MKSLEDVNEKSDVESSLLKGENANTPNDVK